MSFSSKSFSSEAVVLKRTSVGESDRVVTLLSREKGKIVCIAKGVRKLTSSKRAYLEPGNHVKCLLINTHGMPILTQATLVSDCAQIHSQMPKIRQLVQLLEIVDALFVEEQMEENLFDDVLKIRCEIVGAAPTTGKVKIWLEQLIIDMGYQPPQETTYASLLDYVSVLADKPMRSWEYLKVLYIIELEQ